MTLFPVITAFPTTEEIQARLDRDGECFLTVTKNENSNVYVVNFIDRQEMCGHIQCAATMSRENRKLLAALDHEQDLLRDRMESVEKWLAKIGGPWSSEPATEDRADGQANKQRTS